MWSPGMRKMGRRIVSRGMVPAMRMQFSAAAAQKEAGGSGGRKMLRFLAEGVNLSHPDKSSAGKRGEDSLFANSYAIGVADGVGGWASAGIDAGEYARHLMERAGLATLDVGHDSPLLSASKSLALSGAPPASSSAEPWVLSGESTARLPGPPFDPMDVAKCAVAENMDPNVPGSSTITIACTSPGAVRFLNLGDSGGLLLRLGGDMPVSTDKHPAQWAEVFRTQDRTHGFNFPCQVGGPDGDSVTAAVQEESVAAPGDLVILTTDGLLDNLFAKDIINALRRVDTNVYWSLVEWMVAHPNSDLPEEMDRSCRAILQIVASGLAVEAQRIGQSKSSTPFEMDALRHGYDYAGGKLDDVAVVAAMVVPAPDPIPFAEGVPVDQRRKSWEEKEKAYHSQVKRPGGFFF